MDRSILGAKVLITRVLIPRSTILITGRTLRTTPNAIQRHLETLWAASIRATWISDADGVLVSGAMRGIRIGTRGSLVPVLYNIIERLLRAARISPRNANFSRCRARLDAKPRHYESMPVYREATLQSHASVLTAYETDTQRNYNN